MCFCKIQLKRGRECSGTRDLPDADLSVSIPRFIGFKVLIKEIETEKPDRLQTIGSFSSQCICANASIDPFNASYGRD